MFTGIDYVIYTQKKQEVFIQDVKNSFSLWTNPHYVIDDEDETTDIYVAKNKYMFDLMWTKKDFIPIRILAKAHFYLYLIVIILQIVIA